MKFQDLAIVLTRAASHSLDAVDLLILDELAEALKRNERITVMELVNNSSAASHATVHTRLKKLEKSKLISKLPDEKNLRIKYVVFGSRWEGTMQDMGLEH